LPRRHQRSERLQQTLGRVQERYTHSPLSQIGEKLASLITGAQEAIRAGGASPDQATGVANSVEAIMEALPQSFGERFYFDAAMIQAFADDWSQGSIQLSQMIVPKHNNSEWGHRRIWMGTAKGEAYPRVDLILFPGEDSLEHIDLLEYPWFCHELGHNVFFRDDSTFRGHFEPSLAQITHALRLSSIADRGLARDRAVKIVRDIHDVWKPTSDHHNWAHELTMDMIALWTCGPTYLTAFQDFLNEHKPHPYHIDQSHPPYAVRISALIRASECLGWSTYTDSLARTIEVWRKSNWKAPQINRNRYTALAKPELVQACIMSALETCQSLALPKCIPEHISDLREKLRHGEIPEFGMDLLLTAWQAARTLDEEEYERWENETIRALVDSIIQECP